MRIVVASNPAARFGRAGAAGALVASRIADLGHEVQHVVAVGYRGQLEQTRFAMTTADVLVVVGGDGVVHLATNIVGGTSKRLVVVPAGSGSDVAAALGIRSTAAVFDSLEAILASEPDRVDLIRVEHPDGVALAAGIVSIGFDADVNVRSFALTRVPSRPRYQAAIVATLLRPRHRTFGGGIPIAPRADMRDGRLTAVLADEVSYPRFLATLAKVPHGAHESDRRLHVEECESVEIESDETVLVCADGEIVGRLPVRCTIMPGALQVLRERGAPRTASGLRTAAWYGTLSRLLSQARVARPHRIAA